MPHLHEKWHAKIESATEENRLLGADLKEKGEDVTPWLRSLVGGYEPLMYYAAFLMAGAGVLAFFIGWGPSLQGASGARSPFDLQLGPFAGAGAG